MKSLDIGFENSTFENWKNTASKSLKDIDLNDLSTQTLEGITLQAYYDSVTEKINSKSTKTRAIAPFQERFTNYISHFITSPSNSNSFSNKNHFVFCKTVHDLQNANSNCTILFDVFSTFEANGKWEKDWNEYIKEVENQSIDYFLIDVSLHQNAGANASEQIAFILLKIQALIEIFGVEVLHKICVKTAIGSHFLMEISKLKSIQIVLNQLYKSYSIENTSILFCETTWRNKSSLDAENNLIRSTYEALSAMIANADFLHIQAYKNVENPSDYDVELALKQFLLLENEANISFFENASEGSFAIENMTKELSEHAWNLFQKLDEKGYKILLETNIIKEICDSSSEKEQSLFNDKKMLLIGVNASKAHTSTFNFATNQNTYLIPKRLAENIE